MRVLILSAFLAYAAAAPQGFYSPLAPYNPLVYQPYRTVVLPGAVPTISAGDVQAAAINAQVQVNDQVIAAIDQARALNDLQSTGIDQLNEQNGEALSAIEENNWKAIDAANTAAAVNDGAASGSASGDEEPAPPAAEPEKVEEKPAEKTEENQAVEVKAAEPVKAEEKPEVKTIEVNSPVILTNPLINPYSNVYGYNVVPSVGPLYTQPIVRYSPFNTVPGLLGPRFVQNIW